MNYITFFSTRLFSKGDLFYKGEGTSSLEEKCSSPVLNEYFEKFVPKNFIPEFNETNWWDLYKKPEYNIKDEDFLKLIKEHIADYPQHPYEKIETRFERTVKKASADKIAGIVQAFYKIPIIPVCLNILRDDILAKQKLEHDSKIDALAKVYSLAPIKEGEDQYYAYAVDVLGRETQDNEEGKRGWIKTIIEALKALEVNKDKDVSIQLVLHDKDLGGEFVTKDVYVLEKEQIQKLTDDKRCKIMFFKHTSNGIVDLLSCKEKSSKDVYDIVKELMEKYSQMKDKVREIDQLPYTEDESWECYQITQGIKELTDLNSQNKA